MKLKIGKKIALLIIGTVVIALGVSGHISYLLYKQVLVEKTRQQLISVSVLKEAALKDYINDGHAEINYFLKSKRIKPYLFDFLNGNNDQISLVRGFMREMLDEDALFEGIFLLSKDGEVVASTTEEDEGKYKSTEEFYLNSMLLAPGEHVVTFYYDFSKTENTIIHSDPIRDEDGALLGILVGQLNLNAIDDLFTVRPGLGSTGETYMINSSNVVVTDLLKKPGSALKKTIFSPQIEKCLNGQSSFEQNLDYSGDPSFFYASWYPDLKSCLVTEMGSSEVLVPAKNITRTLVLITLLSILLYGAISLNLSKLVTNPILKLRDTAFLIEKGDYSARADIKTGDEIEEMATVFNDMAQNIQSSYGDLEKKVAEKTKEVSKTLEITKNSNVELQKTKSAMLNLLEDEREQEEKHRKEHERLKLILASMGEGLLVIDNDFNVVEINKSTEDLLGVKRDAVVGRKWTELATTFIGKKEIEISERSFTKAVDKGLTIVTEVTSDHYYKTKGGKIFPVVSITAPLKTGDKIIGAVKVFKDATVEKKSRELIEEEIKVRTKEYRDERAKMLASINSLQIGFIITDTDNRINYINPAVGRILGIKDPEITMEKITNGFLPDLDLLELAEECIKTKSSRGVESVSYGNRYLRLFLTPILVGGKNGETIGCVFLFEDETEQKRMERSKDDFFAVASHELRTPLTAIRGNTSLIMEYYKDQLKDPDLKGMVSDMYVSSIRLIEIVNDFLNVSRLEQGRMEFKVENFDITVEAKKAVEELSQYPTSAGVSVEVETPDKPLVVEADKDKTHQIVTNLVGNALKFTKEGYIKVNFKDMEDTIKVIVSDSGIGIPPANQDLLFRKFQQAGAKVLSRDASKGTGMGLYICKLLVEKMGGKIYLEKSELGKGSIFSFELPKGKLNKV